MFCYCRPVKVQGASGCARVYIAGGEPFGRKKALQPLVAEFANVATKEKLAQNGDFHSTLTSLQLWLPLNTLSP